MALYELFLLGDVSAAQSATIEAKLAAVAADYALSVPGEFVVRTAADLSDRDPKASSAALYFGGDPALDGAAIDLLERARIPVVPVVLPDMVIADVLPDTIRAVNAAFIGAADPDLNKLCSVALECLGLLARQRRIFVSYRRDASSKVALQLHDELSANGFDVFLDTHDIRPGEPFQEMLWHRLVDCDVVIMLDTPDYFDSKWTRQELGRALAQNIQVLRLIWPDHVPTRHLSMGDMIRLAVVDLDDAGQLVPKIIADVVNRTERLRSRSVATRHMSIAGKLRTEIERIGGVFEGIGAHRAIALTLPNGLEIQAYPVVGVPTAETLHDIQDKALGAGHGRFPCLVYDHNGIRPAWLAHLEWLDDKIRDVRALKVFDAAWELAEWDS
jgi:hypothetical protein